MIRYRITLTAWRGVCPRSMSGNRRGGRIASPFDDTRPWATRGPPPAPPSPVSRSPRKRASAQNTHGRRHFSHTRRRDARHAREAFGHHAPLSGKDHPGFGGSIRSAAHAPLRRASTFVQGPGLWPRRPYRHTPCRRQTLGRTARDTVRAPRRDSRDHAAAQSLPSCAPPACRRFDLHPGLGPCMRELSHNTAPL